MTYLCNQPEHFEEMLMGDNSQGTFRWRQVKIQWAMLEENMFMWKDNGRLQ